MKLVIYKFGILFLIIIVLVMLIKLHHFCDIFNLRILFKCYRIFVIVYTVFYVI